MASKTGRQHLIAIAKQCWMALMVLGLAYYLWNDGARILLALRAIPATYLFFALLCILLGKLSALILMRGSLLLLHSNWATWRESVWIYASSDIAKYVPGGVWAIVGRVVHYRNHGMSAAGISKALFLEHIGLGATALVISLPVGLIILIGQQSVAIALIALLVGVMALFGLVRVWAFRWRRSMKGEAPHRDLRRALASLAIMMVGWVAMGTSFSLLLPGSGTLMQWFWSVGSYAAAFITGMIAVFAPAGAGVREGVLVLAGQFSGLQATTMLDAAILNRALWVIADLMFFLCALVTRFFAK